MPAQFLTICAMLAWCLVFPVSCSRADKAEKPSFNSERAFGYLSTQVDFGPRVPGTPAHDAALEWLVSFVRSKTPNVSIQTFTGTFGGRVVEMSNILASFYPEKKRRVLLCAHWDSRHAADRDSDPANHTKPVPGANDGASGVAVLLEMANCIAATEPPVGVDIVLFDGEDGGEYGNAAPWLLGSRHFAQVMPPGFHPEYAILVDMVGDADLCLASEEYSIEGAPHVWERVQRLCAENGIPVSEETSAILDDHLPLINRGIPAVDLIDFKYPHWHTISDTPDKCSPESLGKIGSIIIGLLYGENK